MLVMVLAGRRRILSVTESGSEADSRWSGILLGRAIGRAGRGARLHGCRPHCASPNWFVLSPTYTKPLNEKKRVVALARGHWDGKALTDVHDIFVMDQAQSRRASHLGRDGMLYMTTTGNDPQDANMLGGKVLRLKDDGTFS